MLHLFMSEYIDNNCESDGILRETFAELSVYLLMKSSGLSFANFLLRALSLFLGEDF